MKLGIICNGFRQSGGMEYDAIEVVRTLHEFGFEKPYVFSRKFDERLPEFQFIKPVRIPCPLISARAANFYVSWRAGVLGRRIGVDVMIGYCRADCADIVCCGGTHAGFLEAKEGVTLYDRAVMRFERSEYANARRVIAHSRLMASEVARYYSFPRERISVSYPPIDLGKFESPDRSLRDGLRRKFGLDDGKVNFLFVSMSHRRKGFNLLERFFENTDLPVRLVVAGKELPRDDYRNIVCIGYQKNIGEAYTACDYSVLASLYEPFGRAPVESLCCGTPVVMADNLGSSEIIRPDYKIEFKAGDIESLTVALNRATEEADRRREALASATRDSIFTAKFTRDHYTRHLLDVCREVAEEKSRR